MKYLSIDYLIVYAFLLTTLIIGLRASRNIKNIREYVIANKQYSIGVLVLTWLATDIAGETILDMTGSVRSIGILQPLAVFGGCTIAMFMQALFFAPKTVNFPNCLTMGDIMGQLYKGPSQVITGTLGFFNALCIAGMELTVLGLLCEGMLGIDYRWAVGLGGTLLVLYATHGGIKAVALTDVFQFLTLLVVLPMITVTALREAGGIKHVCMQVPATQFQIFTHPKAPHYLALFLTMSVFQFSVIDPALMQRMLMGKTQKQLRNQFLIIGSFVPVLMLAIIFLGLSSIIIYPENTDLPIVLRIVNGILPVGAKGLAIAGLFAVTMATADSFLHAAGLTLVHDVIKPLYQLKGISINELPWVRYMTMFVGALAIAIGIARATDLYNFVLISYQFTGPLLAFPLFAGIIGLKPDRYAFYIASIGTLIIFALTKWLLPEAYSYMATLISVIANGSLFLGIHFVHNKGFVMINRKEQAESTWLWKPSIKTIFRAIIKYIPTPRHIISYSRASVAQYGASYTLFSLFFCFSYIAPYFMWEHELIAQYNIMLYLRLVGALGCGLLLVHANWPQALLPYLPNFYHLLLLYTLPFMSTVMFLLTQGSVEWLINIAINIMFLIALVDWMTFLFLTACGVGLGFLFYSLVLGPITIKLDFSTGYLVVYQSILASLIGLLFLRRRQQNFDQLATTKQQLCNAHQATTDRLVEALQYRNKVYQNLGKEGIGILEQAYTVSKHLQEKATSTADYTLQEASEKLSSVVTYFKAIVKHAKDYLRLQVDTVDLNTLLQAVQNDTKAQELTPRPSLSVQVITQKRELQCDVEKVKKLLTNSVIYLQAHNPKNHPIHLEVDSTQLGYQIASIKGYTKKIEALRFILTTTTQSFAALPELYIADIAASLVPPNAPADLPKVENEQIIAAHYGVFESYETAEGCTQVYILPLRIRDIRPATIDLAEMEKGLEEVVVSYPGAIDLEKCLITLVQEKAPGVNLEQIREAIKLIKKYHANQKRKTGEPFYFHPLTVAKIVLNFSQDQEVIIAALLHDVVEDTPMVLDQLAAMFSPTVAYLVDGVTNFEKGSPSLRLSRHEIIKKLIDEEDNRVLYIKLADRIHNMRTIQGHTSYEKQKAICEETLQFFVPMAKQLGLIQAAEELQSLVFDVLNRGEVS